MRYFTARTKSIVGGRAPWPLSVEMQRPAADDAIVVLRASAAVGMRPDVNPATSYCPRSTKARASYGGGVFEVHAVRRTCP